MKYTLPKILPGKRALIAGRTGSGKTVGATWLLSRSPGYWLVLDKKHDELLGSIGPHVGLESNYSEAWKTSRVLIVRPETSDPKVLDAWIGNLSENWERVGLYIDELYFVHIQGRAGDGLVGWLTRGRSHKQSFIGLTQRPAWISKFCFSEADYLGEFSLSLQDDRKRMYEFTGKPEMLIDLQPRAWNWYDVSRNRLTRYGPVPFNLQRRFPHNENRS